MIRVALTGPHGTGKTYIVDQVADRLEKLNYKVAKMPSLTRALKDQGFPINNESLDESWKTQFLCSTMRILEEAKILTSDADILLADRWILDEYVYTLYFIELAKESMDYDLLDRLDSVATSISFLVDDSREEWDQIFHKYPHPDYPPEVDQHRDSTQDFQDRVFKQFKGVQSSHKELLGVELPLDRDQATDVVFNRCTQLLEGQL